MGARRWDRNFCQQYAIAKILTAVFNRWGTWAPGRLDKVVKLMCVGAGTEADSFSEEVEVIVILTDRSEDDVQMGWLQSLQIFYL